MDEFNIWGQIQEISAGRFLVIATACPVTSGRQMSFSDVVSSPADARQLLGRFMQKLEQQVAARGGRVANVLSLPEHSAQVASQANANRAERRH